MSLSKVIGIISYLPDKDTTKRREGLLKNLINFCTTYFKLPIIIIAQNWPKDLFADRKDITIYRYDKPLTIVGARIKLREKFLESGYDYLIMLDDDCELTGTAEGCQKYLEFIDKNPDCWIARHGSLLKLFAISKTCFKDVEYDDISLERGEGYEDTIFFAKIKKFHKNEYRCFPHEYNINDHSRSAADFGST